MLIFVIAAVIILVIVWFAGYVCGCRTEAHRSEIALARQKNYTNFARAEVRGLKAKLEQATTLNIPESIIQPQIVVQSNFQHGNEWIELVESYTDGAFVHNSYKLSPKFHEAMKRT